MYYKVTALGTSQHFTNVCLVQRLDARRVVLFEQLKKDDSFYKIATSVQAYLPDMEDKYVVTGANEAKGWSAHHTEHFSNIKEVWIWR